MRYVGGMGVEKRSAIGGRGIERRLGRYVSELNVVNGFSGSLLSCV